MSTKKKMELSTSGGPIASFWNDDPFFDSPPSPPSPLRNFEENMNSALQQFGSFFNHQSVGFNFAFPKIDVDSLASDPNASVHSYAASSVTSYKRNGKEKPEIYHAASSQLTAPGGVKETTKTLQDSRSGLKKMAIGRHLQDKGHVAQKSKNYYTGEEAEKEDLLNLEESALPEFNSDWNKISNRPDFDRFRRLCNGSFNPHRRSKVIHSAPGGVANAPLPQLDSSSSSSDLSLDGKKTLMHSGRRGRKSIAK